MPDTRLVARVGDERATGRSEMAARSRHGGSRSSIAIRGPCPCPRRREKLRGSATTPPGSPTGSAAPWPSCAVGAWRVPRFRRIRARARRCRRRLPRCIESQDRTERIAASLEPAPPGAAPPANAGAMPRREAARAKAARTAALAAERAKKARTWPSAISRAASRFETRTSYPVPSSCNEYSGQPGDRLCAPARREYRAGADAVPRPAVDEGERLEPQVREPVLGRVRHPAGVARATRWPRTAPTGGPIRCRRSSGV